MVNERNRQVHIEGVVVAFENRYEAIIAAEVEN